MTTHTVVRASYVALITLQQVACADPTFDIVKVPDSRREACVPRQAASAVSADVFWTHVERGPGLPPRTFADTQKLCVAAVATYGWQEWEGTSAVIDGEVDLDGTNATPARLWTAYDGQKLHWCINFPKADNAEEYQYIIQLRLGDGGRHSQTFEREDMTYLPVGNERECSSDRVGARTYREFTHWAAMLKQFKRSSNGGMWSYRRRQEGWPELTRGRDGTAMPEWALQPRERDSVEQHLAADADAEMTELLTQAADTIGAIMRQGTPLGDGFAVVQQGLRQQQRFAPGYFVQSRSEVSFSISDTVQRRGCTFRLTAADSPAKVTCQDILW
jgi:hypothetical protein